MRRIACALTVALITVTGGFGCHNERGQEDSCTPELTIIVNTSGGFTAYNANGSTIGSDTRPGGRIKSVCRSAHGLVVVVNVRGPGYIQVRDASGNDFRLQFDHRGDGSPPELTSKFLVNVPGEVTITVP